MRNMLRCRRGSAAFATVVALVPLIGMMALGGEAGSWYVTKQRAQGAADAAAYAGALRLACDNAPQPGVTCNNTQTVDYRGKQVAAQNSFCNSGDTSYPGATCAVSLPQGVSKSVQIASLTSWNGTAGTFVQATVSQQQPAYLAQVLNLSTVNIVATAVAQVDSLAKPPCVLALKDAVTFQGSPTVSSATCGISSDSAGSNAIGFVGNSGIQVNAPSYTVGGCSQTGGTQCTGVLTYQQPIPDPLSGVGAAIANLKASDFPGGTAGQCASLQSYESGFCYNAGNQTLNGTLNGTYYFMSGNIKITSSSTTLTSGILGATLIIFGSATLTINGGPLIQLTAVKNPAGPPALSSVSSKMTDLLIYDGEAYSKQGVNITGNSSSYFNGTVYVPNAPVTYGGNSSSSAPTTGCYQVIAYAVNFQGDTTLDNSKCKSDSAATPTVQTVRLVQ
ncbi:pilus assembly protein TadG-related protein [Bradyrhizobium sp. C-145]|uniref:pilus assembly protein TadG-related protein n=1 Tax=Bradyrhizobium sp. C-145 TaxID=574727 RepID=UPI00201B8BFA|nr:pilus assembly protein TadG-related protein [Bradyrhizobium sp. C-145]UQR61104.1 pilus assembly protein TadG-related protein [Bradyrhizobium sp. C-145]